MEIKPIKNDADYEAALAEIDRIFNTEPGTPESDRLEVLSILVEAYEDEHCSISPPDPIDAFAYYMESRGLTCRDLKPQDWQDCLLCVERDVFVAKDVRREAIELLLRLNALERKAIKMHETLKDLVSLERGENKYVDL